MSNVVIYRGTTPTLTWWLPFEGASITVLNIAFSQNRKVILEKKLSDVKIEDDSISLTLTELETLSFYESAPLEIQIRCYCGTDKMVSHIETVSIGRILKDGCLE